MASVGCQDEYINIPCIFQKQVRARGINIGPMHGELFYNVQVTPVQYGLKHNGFILVASRSIDVSTGLKKQVDCCNAAAPCYEMNTESLTKSRYLASTFSPSYTGRRIGSPFIAS
jgi:hypothetical protein